MEDGHMELMIRMYGQNLIIILRLIKLQYKVKGKKDPPPVGWIGAGKRASASWEKDRTGNKAWADVK